MTDGILVINEKDLTPKHKAEHNLYEYFKFEVTSRNDYNQCYVAIYEIPPQKANYPYHYHMANTEVFFIISGQGTLKSPQGNREISAGDIVVCPPSENGAHKIINTSETETLRYIDFDTCNSPDIIHYPDSDKTGIIIHNQSSAFFRNDDKVNYYTGE